MLKRCAILLVLFSISFISKSQSILIKQIIFVDTVLIEKPIIIQFNGIKDSGVKASNLVLISSLDSNHIKSKKIKDYNDVLRDIGYKIYPPITFISKIESYLKNVSDNKLLEIVNELKPQNLKRDSFGYFSEVKSHSKYFEISDIKTERFLLFLINVETVNKWDDENYKLLLKDVSNYYVKVLVPIRD